MTTVFAFFFARLFAGVPIVAPVASATIGLALTFLSSIGLTRRPSRKRLASAIGDVDDGEKAASLLVRQAVRCQTTLQRLGASQQDQYNLAAACYVDLSALFGVDAAEGFRQRHAQIFDRKRSGHDAAMLALGQDLRRLAESVDSRDAEMHLSADAARHVDARLKGFMQSGERGVRS